MQVFNGDLSLGFYRKPLMGLPGSGRAICVRCVHFTHSCINLSAPAMWEQVLRNLLEKCLAAHLIWSIPAQQQSRIWYREPSVTQDLLHRFKLKKIKAKPKQKTNHPLQTNIHPLHIGEGRERHSLANSSYYYGSAVFKTESSSSCSSRKMYL